MPMLAAPPHPTPSKVAVPAAHPAANQRLSPLVFQLPRLAVHWASAAPANVPESVERTNSAGTAPVVYVGSRGSPGDIYWWVFSAQAGINAPKESRRLTEVKMAGLSQELGMASLCLAVEGWWFSGSKADALPRFTCGSLFSRSATRGTYLFPCMHVALWASGWSMREPGLATNESAMVHTEHGAQSANPKYRRNRVSFSFVHGKPGPEKL